MHSRIYHYYFAGNVAGGVGEKEKRRASGAFRLAGTSSASFEAAQVAEANFS
jgi:hypothetical protein